MKKYGFMYGIIYWWECVVDNEFGEKCYLKYVRDRNFRISFVCK